jgi:hypothetical protein
MSDWFESLTGFREESYEATRARLRLDGQQLVSTVNGARYDVGRLRLVSLAELRQESSLVHGAETASLRLENVVADVRALHREPQNEGASFQVASQFNLLEMVGPDVSPEAGVGRYAYDRTQGPACAIAAGAATIYRNYLVDVDGEKGQTSERQLDAIQDLGAALGNADGDLWTMQNGYLLPSAAGLLTIDERLRSSDEAELDALRGLLRVGWHQAVEVSDRPVEQSPHRVSQVFCSALPVSYCQLPKESWQRFACLVLDAAYEATFFCALRNAQHLGHRALYLTCLGGGAFGNEDAWIHAAIARAVGLFSSAPLDVKIVSYGQVPASLECLVQQLGH